MLAAAEIIRRHVQLLPCSAYEQSTCSERGTFLFLFLFQPLPEYIRCRSCTLLHLQAHRQRRASSARIQLHGQTCKYMCVYIYPRHRWTQTRGYHVRSKGGDDYHTCRWH